jgi:hypothetical protein
MITEKLKSNVNQLSADERNELSLYLLKLKMENDEDLMATLRERTVDYYTRELIDVKEL